MVWFWLECMNYPCPGLFSASNPPTGRFCLDYEKVFSSNWIQLKALVHSTACLRLIKLPVPVPVPEMQTLLFYINVHLTFSISEFHYSVSNAENILSLVAFSCRDGRLSHSNLIKSLFRIRSMANASHSFSILWVTTEFFFQLKWLPSRLPFSFLPSKTMTINHKA